MASETEATSTMRKPSARSGGGGADLVCAIRMAVSSAAIPVKQKIRISFIFGLVNSLYTIRGEVSTMKTTEGPGRRDFGKPPASGALGAGALLTSMARSEAAVH